MYCCVSVFVYLCICVILALSLKARAKISIDWDICFSWFLYKVLVYFCICVLVYLSTFVFVYLCPMARRLGLPEAGGLAGYNVFVYFCICICVLVARRLGLPEAGGLAGRLSDHSPHSSCLTAKPALARQCKQIQMLFANKYKYSISKYKYLFRM